MIRLTVLAGGIALLAACSEIPTEPRAVPGDRVGSLAASADEAARIAICHLSEETGLFHRIQVSANSERAHRDHGDALPGEPVPGVAGKTFDETCALVSIGPSRIVFRSSRPGTYGGDLFVMESDGSGLLHLTSAQADDREPHWSRDGTRIAFRRQITGRGSIFTVGGDGTGLTQVTFPTSGADLTPRWSPDGSKIAFVSTRDGDREIYVVNSDGSGEQRLTNSAGLDLWPRWSPDGTRILFQSFRGGALGDIYVMNADGSGLVQLTFGTRNDLWADWSPDGSRIAYTTSSEGIYVMNADGSNAQLVQPSPRAHMPRWSPDGAKIAYIDAGSGLKEVHVMNPDGSGDVNITNSTSNEQDLAWSPDGQQLVTAGFDSTNGEHDIFRVNVDGTGRINLTSVVGTDDHPNWAR